MVGQSVGKYRIVSQLGRGGMGTVYKAVDKTLQRDVAIKALNGDVADPNLVRHFHAEATILARLSHPEIATIYEFLRLDTQLLIVMEYVRGETLERILARRSVLTPDAAAYVIDKILSALEYAHRAGVVHCDIKPANIMVAEHGGIKIMDFGTARVRGLEHTAADGYLMGTPAYMAPEQVLGDQLDGRADLYAVGVMMYRLLAGTLPFEADSPSAMVERHVAAPPTPLAAHRKGLPDWCEQLVERALAKSPADRFQTAAEFRDVLRTAAGLVSTDLTNALSISVAEGEHEEHPSVALEHSRRVPVRRGPAGTVILQEPHRSAVDVDREAIARPSWRFRLTRSVALGVAALLVIVASVAFARYTRRRPPAPSARSIPARRTTDFVLPLGSSQTSAPHVDAPPPAAKADAAVPSKPMAFRARMLLPGAGDVDAVILLTDEKIVVEDSGDGSILREVPYDGVVSIFRSRGVDPLWRSDAGAGRVARVGGGKLGAFGIFVERDWVSLRVKDVHARFIIFHFDDDAQARNAVAALEERTGLRAERVARSR
jgi:serine/threonine-protein kinase